MIYVIKHCCPSKSTYSFYEVDVGKQCSYKISINPHLTTHLIWSRIKSIKFPSIFDLEDTPHYTLNRIPRFEMDRFLEKCTSDIVFVKFSSVTCSCHLGWFAGIYILYQIYLNRGYTSEIITKHPFPFSAVIHACNNNI